MGVFMQAFQIDYFAFNEERWRGVEKSLYLFFLCLMVKYNRNKNNALKGNSIIKNEKKLMSYIDRLNAATYLSEHTPQIINQKSLQKWHIWLRDNHAFKNNNGIRIPFKKEGRKTYYETKELDLLIGQLVARHKLKEAEKTSSESFKAMKEAIETPITAKESKPPTVDKVEGVWWRETATIHPIAANCDGSRDKAVIQFVTNETPPRVYNLSRNDLFAFAGSIEAAHDIVLALSGEYAPHLH